MKVKLLPIVDTNGATHFFNPRKVVLIGSEDPGVTRLALVGNVLMIRAEPSVIAGFVVKPSRFECFDCHGSGSRGEGRRTASCSRCRGTGAAIYAD